MFSGANEFLRLNIAIKKLSHNNMDCHFKALLERDTLPDVEEGYTGDIGKIAVNLVVLREELNKIKDQCDEGLKLIGELGNQMH